MSTIALKTVASQAIKASRNARPNYFALEAKRVVPAVGTWGVLMFGFLTWSFVPREMNKRGYWSV
ncbi:Hypothetical protein PP7435_CHR2-1968 [Komagataella phaffii CBS 7435]|uniref:Uncharacterized protein n=1 Tax=Komagataella phaffii (strain ATCC 76273 / CBS 7435 / CECT 11047 / NRRL Y-11430 / Wegner 21-1) TaxID=981350 RepID=A0A1G4KPT7_KOMPC|nr:Hypothetical protein BQ9382_C2-2752 [Komagataella phaffii CBS 7435]SCV12026.1 Hypothetical protein PP7435_CHR2-1968 [Komagataella phaffii CBS 7435]